MEAINYPLQVPIAYAYHLPYNSPRLTGGPAWVRSARYDIEAKADEPAGASRAQMNMMLQKLLADRFQLTLRRETKELPVYALAVAKSGLKLTPAATGEGAQTLSGGQGCGIHGKAAAPENRRARRQSRGRLRPLFHAVLIRRPGPAWPQTGTAPGSRRNLRDRPRRQACGELTRFRGYGPVSKNRFLTRGSVQRSCRNMIRNP